MEMLRTVMDYLYVIVTVNRPAREAAAYLRTPRATHTHQPATLVFLPTLDLPIAPCTNDKANSPMHTRSDNPEACLEGNTKTGQHPEFASVVILMSRVFPT